MRTQIRWAVCESPLGPLTLRGDRHGLAGLRFPESGAPADATGAVPKDAADHDSEAVAVAVRQLDEYFGGSRRRFDLGLHLAGTPFQRAVWERLLTIPYGTTVSYSALAADLGRSSAVRAVAAAVGRTPVPILVPCHRVVASDGGLTGYLGGLDRKRALLDLESRATAASAGSINIH